MTSSSSSMAALSRLIRCPPSSLKSELFCRVRRLRSLNQPDTRKSEAVVLLGSHGVTGNKVKILRTIPRVPAIPCQPYQCAEWCQSAYRTDIAEIPFLIPKPTRVACLRLILLKCGMPQPVRHGPEFQ